MIGGHGLTRFTLATLEAQLPGAIAELNAEPGAPVVLEDIGYFYPYGSKGPIPFYPAVEVGSPDQRYDAFDLAAREADGVGVVKIAVWVQGHDIEVRLEKASRYASAVLSILSQPSAMGPGSRAQKAEVYVRAADPERTNDPDPMLAGALIVVLADFVEAMDL